MAAVFGELMFLFTAVTPGASGQAEVHRFLRNQGSLITAVIDCVGRLACTGAKQQFSE
jgi:hypothetical protein